MNKLINETTRVILIGGSSHVGKSTLAQFLAAKLGWNYLSTDSLARHPGRPWVNSDRKAIKDRVAEHYRTLCVEALVSDVLSHYKKNVLSQIEVIVDSYESGLSKECVIVEGSALYPKFVVNLVSKNSVKAIWLTANDGLFRNRIKNQSNFDSVSGNEKYLIQKFLARTLLYNKLMKEEVERLGFISIDVSSTPTIKELSKIILSVLSFSHHLNLN